MLPVPLSSGHATICSKTGEGERKQGTYFLHWEAGVSGSGVGRSFCNYCLYVAIYSPPNDFSQQQQQFTKK